MNIMIKFYQSNKNKLYESKIRTPKNFYESKLSKCPEKEVYYKQN